MGNKFPPGKIDLRPAAGRAKKTKCKRIFSVPHTITYIPEPGIIEVKFTGGITLKEAIALIAEIGPLMKEHDCFLILSDYREAKLKVSTVDIYSVPNLISAKISTTGDSVDGLKRALVIARDQVDFQFLETVSGNRGQETKLFEDVDKAKAWLMGK